jgi:hypothetical protein
VYAWGDDPTIRSRVGAFHAAGADHVALQIVTGGATGALPWTEWRRLAEVLT